MQPPLAPDTVVDSRYRIRKLLGGGAQGFVYLAEELELQRLVALKVLRLPGEENQVIFQRLQREAKALQRLEHPNIVGVYRLGQLDQSSMYLSMEYVAGESLSERLNRSPLTLRQALEIAFQVAAALHEAETHAIIHRDVKPQNVLLASEAASGNSSAKLVDFGLCKLSDDLSMASGKLTRTAATFGTPLYMSPEQCYGQKIDTRSDVYSFGCMLFEMLTGAPPFNGDTPADLLRQHVSAQPPKPQIKGASSRFQSQLQTLHTRCLAKDPADRFQSFADVIGDLRNVMDLLAHEKINDNQKTCIDRTGAPNQSKSKSVRRALCLALSISALLFGLVYAASGETKGKVLSLAAAFVGGNPTELLISGINVIYLLNGPDQARTAADASINRSSGGTMTAEQWETLSARYQKLFEQHRSMQNAAIFAESLLSYYLNLMEERRQAGNTCRAEELTHLQSATRFFLRTDLDRETWKRLNNLFDDWDRNSNFGPFPMQNQIQLQMELHELESQVALRSGAVTVDRQGRRALSHWLSALESARKLKRKVDFEKYLSCMLGAPPTTQSAEYEIFARLVAAEWALEEKRLPEAKKHLEICSSLQSRAHLKDSQSKQLEAARKQLRELVAHGRNDHLK